MQCRICNSKNLDLAIDLGNHPWANHFLRKEEVGSELFYPLQVFYCQNCTTTQLNHTIKKEIMFSDHTYLSGITQSLNNHFKSIAEQVDAQFFKNQSKKSVLDIGSNDGTQLKHFKNLGYQVLGVESSKTTAKIANEAGVETLNEFFNLDLIHRINQKFDIINASGVFFHLEELHSVTEGIREGLKENGIFVVQFLYMKQILKNLAFDQIYHEHLLYYNLKNIEILLNQHGLALFDAYLSPIHGGSIIGFITHQKKAIPSEQLNQLRKIEEEEKSNHFSTYQKFAEKIKRLKKTNLSYLENAKKDKKRIYGFGAPVKGNTLLNYFGIGIKLIDYLVEKNSLRKNLYSPGMHIPIMLEDEVSEYPDIYYVLAWNFKKEILANNQALINKGVEFYFPINPV